MSDFYWMEDERTVAGSIIPCIEIGNMSRQTFSPEKAPSSLLRTYLRNSKHKISVRTILTLDTQVLVLHILEPT